MNKKIVILVVVVECILAILLISVLGLAIKAYYGEVDAQEIYFVSFKEDPEIILKEGEEDGWKKTEDGKVILVPGTLYKEKENTIEWLPTPDYNEEVTGTDQTKTIIIEFYNPNDVKLSWIIVPDNTTDKTVEFKCKDEEVEIDKDGRVHFLGEVHSVQITAKTKSGKTAVIELWPKKSSKPNPLTIDEE